MKQIELMRVANQRLSYTTERGTWDVEIKAALRSMTCSVWHDGIMLLSCARIAAGSPIIPYPHMALNGNLAIIDARDDDAPIWWEKFGISQSLVYWE